MFLLHIQYLVIKIFMYEKFTWASTENCKAATAKHNVNTPFIITADSNNFLPWFLCPKYFRRVSIKWHLLIQHTLNTTA